MNRRTKQICMDVILSQIIAVAALIDAFVPTILSLLAGCANIDFSKSMVKLKQRKICSSQIGFGKIVIERTSPSRSGLSDHARAKIEMLIIPQFSGMLATE